MARRTRTDELIVFLDGELVGHLRQDGRGDLAFEYHSAWVEQMFSYPLSLSMPMRGGEHRDPVVRPFFEGLLPDDPQYLRNVAKRHQVSHRNPFAILAIMGEDCAGAVQVVRPERGHLVLGAGWREEDVQWVEEDEIARDLRDLVDAHVNHRPPTRDYGYFSLAGAQPKVALLHREGRWGKPRGGAATSHILKPPAVAGADGLAINEHFCLRLARAAGLPAAESEVREFAGETVIVVTRYDRRRDGDRLMRVHQEDMCQALAVPPIWKYEQDGGPGVAEIINLLLAHADDPDREVTQFVDALALNLAIAGTDAHAKNYSLLLEHLPMVRMAPLYDLISILPYSGMQSQRKIKMAMRIGKEYLLWKIDRRCWVDLAARVQMDADPLVERVAWMMERVRDAVPGVAEQVRDEGLAHPVVDRLEEAIPSNVEQRLRSLGHAG